MQPARAFAAAGLACLSLALAAPVPASASGAAKRLSEYSLTNWTEEDGPFPFGVLCIAQDRDGYLWLGGRSGLIRFDGNSFEVWRGSEPLPSERLSNLIAARDGSLWLGFGTVGAITRIVDGHARTFTTKDGLAGGPANIVYEDRDGSIWVGSYNGLSHFAGGFWTHVSVPDGIPADEPVAAVLRDRAGRLWVGTGAGLYRRDQEPGPFERVSGSAIAALAQDAAGAIWGADRESGFQLISGTPTVPLVTSAASHAGAGRGLLVDRQGSLWVATRGAGLMRLSDGGVERLTRVDGLGSDDVRDVFEDRDGAVWIATRRGLSRLTERSVRSVAPTLARDAFVYAVTSTPDGSVWTATAEGLARTHAGREWLYGPEHGLPARIVTALHADRAGVLWAATTRGVARWTGARFEAAGGGVEQLQSVASMTSDHRGRLWLSDQARGLFMWARGTLTRASDALRDRKQPYYVYADRADRVWVGFWDTGIARFDPDGTVTTYSTLDGVPGGNVSVIHEDRAGHLVVGTERGIAVFDGQRFSSLSERGLPESGYVSIIEDERGFVWLAAGIGLLRLSPGELDRVARERGSRIQYTLYGADDGLNGHASRPGMPSSAVRDDGSLLFVTSAGLALVDPGNLRERPTTGRVRIERITADGQSIDTAGPIALAPRTSRLQIDYSVLSLAGVAKARFRYRLDGFDKSWIDADDRRQALYTNLPPGEYAFRVVTATDTGWNESGATVGFTMRPAFYQRPVFYAGVAVLVLGAIWLAWIRRLSLVRQQFSLILAERARMGRELHDTLLQSLVGVALEFDDISEQLDPNASALRQQVKQIRQRVEHYIREARGSIWNLRSPTLETKDLAAALHEAGELGTMHHGIDFGFEVTGRPVRLDLSTEEQFLRIGQEAVSNAVRHGRPETIRMSLHYSVESAVLTVDDNGCGFDVSAAEGIADHWGLTTMRERARQVNARFSLQSEPGRGTTVTVSVTRAQARAPRLSGRWRRTAQPA